MKFFNIIFICNDIPEKKAMLVYYEELQKEIKMQNTETYSEYVFLLVAMLYPSIYCICEKNYIELV